MKVQLSKQTGIALALLATLLATLLAMGAFPVAQANEHEPSATRSFSGSAVSGSVADGYTVAAGGEVVVTITMEGSYVQGVILEKWPSEFEITERPDFGVLPINVLPEVDGDDSVVGYRIINRTGEIPTFSYKLTAPQAAGDSDSFVGNFGGQVDSVEFGGSIGGATMITVAAAATGGNGDGNGEPGTGIALNTYEPGAAVQITITDSADPSIFPDEQIEMDLSGFSVPATIADSDISISSEGYRGNPSNVVVNGSTVTMTVPNVKANGDDQRESVWGDYTIRIKQSAGVTNAASGGEKTVSWQENAPDGAEKEATVTIQRVIKLSATAGTRGTMTTATFKGFADGSATINLNNAKLDEVTITDNTGTLEIDTTSTSFKANEDNRITAQDAAGNPQTAVDVDVDGTVVDDGAAVFTISPKAVVDPEESPVSKDVTIKLSDWPIRRKIDSVKIGRSDVTPGKPDPEATPAVPDTRPSTDSAGKAEFKVMVPADANRGTQTVKVTGIEVDDSTPSASASLKVGVLTLTIQPAMVVPGQEITIQGSGFVADDEIEVVEIGNQEAKVDATDGIANSAGNIVITVRVPSDKGDDELGIGSGTKTVSVTANGSVDSSGRVAEGTIEIPKAAITLDPVTSRRGTTVNVSGSGFPSSDLVQVNYEISGDSVTVAAGSADASGAVSIDFSVPSNAQIGSKHNIEAISVGVFKSVTAKATHETPGAMVTLSTDNIASGQNITISGVNFPAFATVAVMEIGGIDVRPVPAPATSIDGDFESTVLVPQLELGNQTVKVRVSSTTITTFLELATATVSRAPADVFASLGDRLVRVWYLERSTQVWSFYDPDSDVAAFNTLTEVSSGQNVSIIISSGANIGFQDKTLYPGTNPIALD